MPTEPTFPDDQGEHEDHDTAPAGFEPDEDALEPEFDVTVER